MSYNIYVYYRVGPEVADALRRSLANMQRSIARASGITGKILTSADEPLLWMEVYEAVVDRAAFMGLLQQAADASGVTDLLPPSARHVETFLNPR